MDNAEYIEVTVRAAMILHEVGDCVGSRQPWFIRERLIRAEKLIANLKDFCARIEAQRSS